ncbi:MAG: glycosyltransferase [Lachnospiraceae bacterium]|nr:glycosyltransferase [Lachnospiraceae bacterium]
MKKILFVMNTMGRAGAEMALLELLRRLSQKDLELFLYVLTGQGEMLDSLPDGVKLLNKEYHSVSVHTAEGKKLLAKNSLRALFRRGTVFKLFPYLVKQLFCMLGRGKILPDKLLWRVFSDAADRFEEEYDLAVAYIEGGSTYYVADHVKAKKKVAFFHVDYGMAGYTRSLDRECYLQYDRIFPVSDEVREAFLKEYPECQDRTEVFHNLINQERVLQMANQKGGFTDDFDGYRILTVGRLMSQKDFAQSIQAMKLLKDRGVKARWYILGEGEQREELEKLIKKLKLEQDFFLPGATKNPYAYMAQADLYVHATRFEGKSIAIQEAQILGCAILVSDCSGNREQVVHGVDGLLCELTPEGIAAGVESLLAEKEKRVAFGQAAAKRHRTQDTEVDKMLSLI